MKKIISVVLMAAFVMGIAGCNSSTVAPEATGETKVTTNTTESEEEISLQREVEYEINSEIDKYLHLDSETISALDSFYLTVRDSYLNIW